jgi:hypothetical protein
MGVHSVYGNITQITICECYNPSSSVVGEQFDQWFYGRHIRLFGFSVGMRIRALSGMAQWDGYAGSTTCRSQGPRIMKECHAAGTPAPCKDKQQ